jgi:hypothetical protein
MLTLRTRLFIIISLIVLVILGIAVGLVVWNKRAKVVVEPPSATTTTPGAGATDGVNIIPGGSTTGLQVQKPTTEEAQKIAVKQLAKVFIERYGSYSTDGDFQNIKELNGMTTDKLWAELSKKIGATAGGNFVGVTTKAIAAVLSDWKKDLSATVDLQLVATETRSGRESTVQKTAQVKFLKVKTQWLVDSFTLGK